MIKDIYGEFVGLDSLYLAKVIEDSLGNYTVEAPRYLAPVGEASAQVKENKSSTAYDNKIHRTYVSESESEVNLTVANIPAILLAEINGKSYNPASGRVYDNGQPIKSYYALGFRYSIGDNDFRYQWFLKGMFTAGAEAAKSKGENIDIKPYQFTYSALPTTHMFTYTDAEGEEKTAGLKRVFGDTTDAAFDAAGWFSQVQTPDTVGEPDAIALSSIVPTDDATDVAVDASIVVTFNNPIKSDNINVIDVATGSIVAITKIWNAARTVLTMAHAAAFTNGTLYHTVLAGVTDDYGQELAAAIKDFTTISE